MKLVVFTLFLCSTAEFLLLTRQHRVAAGNGLSAGLSTTTK
jgi:hypothetical protein